MIIEGVKHDPDTIVCVHGEYDAQARSHHLLLVNEEVLCGSRHVLLRHSSHVLLWVGQHRSLLGRTSSN